MKNSLVLILLIFASSSYAQTVKFGVKAGINESTFKATSADQNSTSSEITGYHLGAFIDFGWRNISIQPAVLYTTKGAIYQDDYSYLNSGSGVTFHGRDEITYKYLELPVNILYHIPVGIGKVFVGGGPYVALGISGKAKSRISGSQTDAGITTSYTQDSDASVTFGNQATEVKNPDYGVNALVGITLKNGLLFSAGYGFGLANLNNYGNYKSHNNVLSISAGYSFL